MLGIFDRAVEWLVSQGFTSQWGDQPWTGQPRRRALAEEWCAGGGGWFAQARGVRVGFLAVGEAVAPVPPAEVPEVYVRALVTSREAAARGAGRLLLEHAAALAGEQGVDQVRVDCFAGNDGRLVAFYESCGFTPTELFTVGESWVGQVLVRDLG